MSVPASKDTVNVTFRKIIDFIKFLLALAVVYCIFLVWKSYDFKVIPLDNIQMTPVFRADSFHVCNRLTHWSELKYGDVIYYTYPIEQNKRHESFFMGRILGLPGDRIHLINGKCYRNGILIEEPYIGQNNTSYENYPEIIVPCNCMYLLVDNRRNLRYIHDKDSRCFGPLLIHCAEGILEPK